MNPSASLRPTSRSQHVRETPSAMTPSPVHAVEGVQRVASGIRRTGVLCLAQRPKLAAAVGLVYPVAHARSVHVHHSSRRRRGSRRHGGCRTNCEGGAELLLRASESIPTHSRQIVNRTATDAPEPRVAIVSVEGSATRVIVAHSDCDLQSCDSRITSSIPRIVANTKTIYVQEIPYRCSSQR